MKLVRKTMKGKSPKHQVSHRQARKSVYRVFSCLKRGANAGMSVHDVAEEQECTAEASDISVGSVLRNIKKGNVAICISL